LKAGWSSCNFTDYSDRYGKISSSWDEEGADNSRLKNWLSPNQDLDYITPLNLTDTKIDGPNSIVCTNSAQYSTFAGLLDIIYEWTVTAGLQILSGQGTAYVTNPASTSLTVTAKTIIFKGEKSEKSIEEVNIYEQAGNLKKHQNFAKTKSVNVDVSSLKPGIYFVEIVDGTFKERQKLIIAR
jgi:hypothetical protein